ncbi:hypothetical protein HZB94_04255 [Candidatus Falkowbacteria bacterium]|nr:hypothetical protein [Candidatus Falkowbacteria bacterium]
MSSLCEQIKTEYEQLQALKEQLILEYEKVKDSDNLNDWSVVKKLQAEWESAYTNLDKKLYITVEMARELLGRENVLGPEEVERTFGVRLEEVPEIPFSSKELERARELGQFLVLRVDKAPDGQPLTMKKMNELLEDKFKKGNKGKILCDPSDPSWYQAEEFYISDAPELHWALVSRETIPNSTNKNYLQQTQELVRYLTDKVFKDQPIPPEYQEAIDEF